MSVYHKEIHRGDDLLTEEPGLPVLRSSLVPLWMHLVMSALALLHVFCIAVCIFAIVQDEVVTANKENIGWYKLVLFILSLVFAGKIAGCILIWCGWSRAVGFTIGWALALLPVLLLTLIAIILDESAWIALYVILPYVLLHLVFIIRLFLVRHRWKRGTEY